MMSKKQEGFCHICGRYGKLTFEHIPPKKALNSKKAMVYQGEEALKKYIQKITMQAIRNIKNKALFPTKVGK